MLLLTRKWGGCWELLLFTIGVRELFDSLMNVWYKFDKKKSKLNFEKLMLRIGVFLTERDNNQTKLHLKGSSLFLAFQQGLGGRHLFKVQKFFLTFLPTCNFWK